MTFGPCRQCGVIGGLPHDDLCAPCLREKAWRKIQEEKCAKAMREEMDQSPGPAAGPWRYDVAAMKKDRSIQYLIQHSGGCLDVVTWEINDRGNGLDYAQREGWFTENWSWVEEHRVEAWAKINPSMEEVK